MLSLVRQHDDYLRWLYRGGRPNWLARVQNRMSAIAFAAGIWPKRVASLEVRGRRTGRTISFPVVIADHGGERYLVAIPQKGATASLNVAAAGALACFEVARRRE